MRPLSIGAMTTYTDVLMHPVIRDEFPLLCEAAAQTGGIATQNRGTIGGNVANASPAADTPPALLVYDAELELISVRGARRVPYDRFHTGYKTTELAADELIARVHLPRGRQGWTSSYRKVGTRRAQAIAKVCFRRGVEARRRSDRGHPDRVRQRCPCRRARRHGRAGVAGTATEPHDHLRRLQTRFVPTSRQSTTSDRPRAIAVSSRASCCRHFFARSGKPDPLESSHGDHVRSPEDR